VEVTDVDVQIDVLVVGDDHHILRVFRMTKNHMNPDQRNPARGMRSAHDHIRAE
jgi:hypothetical protein